ncbi:MAG: hypothetical protein AAFN10_13740 [Bacteroidota bacterium]
MRNRYKYLVIGKTGPYGFIFVGILVSAIAFILLYTGLYTMGGIFLLLGLAFLGSFTAVRLDLKRMRVKHHINILGIWFGRWRSMEKYPDIVVLNKKLNFGHMAYSFYSRNECSVYLMSRNHLKSIRLYRCFNRFQANDKARKLSLLLNKDYVQYNPGMQFQRVMKY